MIEDAVFLELKAIRTLESSHESQLLNYMRATSIEVGLLLNFGPKPQVKGLSTTIPGNATAEFRINL